MNDETKLKLLEIAASLTGAALRQGDINKIDFPDKAFGGRVDVTLLFAACAKVVKEQYELLGKESL